MTIDTVVIITKVLPNNQIRILDAAGDPHVITAPPDASLELLRSLAVSRQKVIHLRVINGHVSLVAIDPEVLEDQEGIIAAHREAVAHPRGPPRAVRARGGTVPLLHREHALSRCNFPPVV